MDFFLVARYFHLISIFLVVGTLFFEAVMVRKTMSRGNLKLVSRIDGLYGLAAIMVVGMGLWMWLGPVGKPAQFYSSNPLFHTKVGLFILIGILSIWPTVFFIKNRKGDPTEKIDVPKHIRMLVYLEVGLLAVIPLLAIMMARGINSF